MKADDEIGTCRDRGELIVIRQKIAEKNSTYMLMWDDVVVNDNDRVINMAASRLLVQMYFANSVELDIKIGLSKIHAKTTKSELVKVIVHGNALQLMHEGQARPMSKCSFGVAASSACNLFCVSVPWLRRSVRTQQSSLTMSMTLITIVSPPGLVHAFGRRSAAKYHYTAASSRSAAEWPREQYTACCLRRQPY